MDINEYTFSNLFGKHTAEDGSEFEINCIEIPIIQRDYAQGRTSDKVNRVRDRFLDTIYNALTNHKKLTLDFVYGEIAKGKLIPLDGQQRLTTLFLLHWYAAQKEHIDPSDYQFLKGFSYYTRPSSRDFCTELVEFISDDSKPSLSEIIINQPWFQYQWLSDPTINSMLVMLDAISNKFSSLGNLWSSLVNEQLITFYFLPIDKMGMSDELYIKMNSRGKPLTEFEHFKAEFETLVAQQDEKMSNNFNKKFDLDWTDMLFPYRGENKIIDDEFMRYFFFISDILCYRQGIPLEKDEFRLAEKLYGKENTHSKENLSFLESSFDCWCHLDIDAFFEKHFSLMQYERGKTKIFQDDRNLFKQCCDNYGEYEGRNRKFPLNVTLLLFAILVYRQNTGTISEEDFQKRIRIVRNLIWNSQYEIRADGQRNNMPKLLEETESIMLSGEIPMTETSGSYGYNKLQKEEEILKIEWLKKNEEYRDELNHLEDHDLLFGCISVVGLENPELFGRFRELFNNCEKTLISKALLCIGDYSQTTNENWQGVTWQLGTENKSTWRELFHPTNRRDGFDNTKNTLTALLSTSSCFDNTLLNNIIDSYLTNPDTRKTWRYYFVKYPQMLSESYGMYFTYHDGDYHTLKMNALQKNGKTWNVFLFALYYVLNEKYELGDYAYQGDKMYITDNLQLDCNQNQYVVHHNDDETEEWFTIPQDIPQDGEGVDLNDRVEMGVEIVNRLIE